ncbi:MAG: hypothetical protein V1772_02165, partial [Chloroflexota bacterium]
MRITDITITVVDLGPLAQPFWNSIIKTSRSAQARIEIHTDAGVTGMGSCSASGSARATILGGIKAKLVGQDPLRINQLWDLMYMGGTRKPVAKGDYIACMSMVDIALWDLAGKVLGQPAWVLAGGAQERVWAYAAGGYYAEGKGPAELAV